MLILRLPRYITTPTIKALCWANSARLAGESAPPCPTPFSILSTSDRLYLSHPERGD
jgi:hypothetical protein